MSASVEDHVLLCPENVDGWETEPFYGVISSVTRRGVEVWALEQPGRTTHVRVWSDNVNAVSWTNRMHSDNSFAQEIIRAIGLFEAKNRFRMSRCHLPGAASQIADAGLRIALATDAMVWTNFLCSWSQTPILSRTRKIYQT